MCEGKQGRLISTLAPLSFFFWHFIFQLNFLEDYAFGGQISSSVIVFKIKIKKCETHAMEHYSSWGSVYIWLYACVD